MLRFQSREEVQQLQIKDTQFTRSLIHMYLSALKEYNHMLIHGSYLQWQVALAKLEVLQKLVIDVCGPIRVNREVLSSGPNKQPYYGYVTVEIDGHRYEVPVEVKKKQPKEE